MVYKKGKCDCVFCVAMVIVFCVATVSFVNLYRIVRYLINRQCEHAFFAYINLEWYVQS